MVKTVSEKAIDEIDKAINHLKEARELSVLSLSLQGKSQELGKIIKQLNELKRIDQ